MSITIKALCGDSLHFIRNHFYTILLVALVCTFLSIGVDVRLHGVISLPEFQAGFINMQQQKVLSNDFSSLILHHLLPLLAIQILINTLFICALLTALISISQGERISTLQVFGKSLSLLPIMLLFFILYKLLVTAGLMVLFVPGIFIYFALSMTPVILAADKTGFFTAIKHSIKITVTHTRFVLPILFLGVAAKLGIPIVLHSSQKALALSSSEASSFTSIIATLIDYLFMAFILTYLFRLYMLIKK